MQNQQLSIERINSYLEAVAITNSFMNDGKTYSIALLDIVDANYEDALRKHLQVKKWTFDLKKTQAKWRDTLNEELLFYFGQYVLKAKEPHLAKEYAGLKNEEFAAKNTELILNSEANAEYLLDKFLNDIEKLIGENYIFLRVLVNWHNSDEGFYECYENDYLFDLGNQILFLHFGGSD